MEAKKLDPAIASFSVLQESPTIASKTANMEISNLTVIATTRLRSSKMPTGEKLLEEDDDHPGRFLEAEGDFLQDPAQWEDRLPQPFRSVDELLQAVLRDAWEAIEARERERTRARAIERVPELLASRVCVGDGARSGGGGSAVVWRGGKVCVVEAEGGAVLVEGEAVGVEEVEVGSYVREEKVVDIVAALTRIGEQTAFDL